MDAALIAHEPASGPLENLLRLPGLGALAARVNLSGPRSAERFDLAIDAGALRARAQGSIDMAHLSAELDFALDSPALAPRPDIAWQRASVHGRWHGSLQSPNADAHIEADELTLPGAAAAAVNADFRANAGAAVLHAAVGGLRIAGLRTQLLQSSPLNLDATMRLDQAAHLLDVTASHRLVSVHASTEVTPARGAARSALFEARVPDLAPWAGLAGQNVRGSAQLKGQVRGDGTAVHVTLDANSVLSVGDEVWSGAVGERAALQLSGTVTDDAITLESMKFTGRALSVNANGDLSRPAPGGASRSGAPDPSPASLRARWDFNVADLKTISPLLAGTLKGSGSINGPTDALAGQAQLTTTMSVRGSPAGTVAADLKMRGLPKAPTGTLAIRGELDAAPVEIDVAVQSPGGSWRAFVNRAEWKSAHANGDVTMAPATAQTHGQLRFGVDRLEDLQDLLGMKVGGSLAGTAVFQPDHGHTRAELHLDARDVTAGQFAGTAQLTAEGLIDALGFKLDVQLPKLRGAKATLTAKGSLDLGSRSIAVASATANYRGQDLVLLAPARIALASGLAVDDLKIGAQTAELEIKGEISPALDLRASLLRVQPALVNMFAPGLLESGTIEAHAQLQGSLDSPTGEVRLSALGVRMADDAAFGLPSLDVQAAAQLHGDTAEIDGHLVAGTASRLNVTGRIPLSADGALNLKIDGTLDVAMINPLLEARGQRAAGELTIDATVAGNAAEPQIAGTVNLAKGSVRDYGRGVSITDITAAIVGSEGTLQIKSFTAMAAPGSLSMTGKIGVLQPKIPMELEIKARNAQPLVSKLVTANLNADLRVTGTVRERLEVAGTVHLNRTLIGIPNGLPPDVAVLDVRRRGKAAPPAPEKPLVVGLDVAVEAPQEILVQGRGLDAEMAGELHLSGTLDTPAVSGSFGLVRGNFSLSGSKLSFLPESRMSFNGAGLKNKIDPTLDFTAQSSVGEVTATLHITGYADAPQFEFTSSPPLGQDEIMAYLLFGIPGSQLSPLQLAQTAAALASLSGVGGGGGLNPLVKLQKSLGLDRLTLGAGATTNTASGPESTGASIAAGRYITKRIYIEAKQTTTGTTQLETDVDLTKHLKLQTRLGNGTATVIGTTPENDPGSSIGLLYQFEY
jgi:translocation and assembly module TamB